MNIDSQRLGYKLNRLDLNYSRKLQANLANSQGSFSQIETPGWSSMIKSELSDPHNAYQHDKKQHSLKQQILSKLRNQNSLPWNQQHQRKMLIGKAHDKNQTRDTCDPRMNSLTHNKSKNQASIKKQKRFKQITVHQHLYMQSTKQQNKRLLQKVIDNQIKKQRIFSFQPCINKKSVAIAEMKFSRAKQNIQFDRDVKAQKKRQEQQLQQTRQSEQYSKQSKQIQQFRLLNQTFYFLTQGETFLTQTALKNTVQQLPIPCLRTLQPILEKIYQGKTIQWVQFVQNFNSAQIKNRQSFYYIIKVWFDRRKKKNQIQKKP